MCAAAHNAVALAVVAHNVVAHVAAAHVAGADCRPHDSMTWVSTCRKN